VPVDEELLPEGMLVPVSDDPVLPPPVPPDVLVDGSDPVSTATPLEGCDWDPLSPQSDEPDGSPLPVTGAEEEFVGAQSLWD
jgi:hypothetical protein